jgi:hypothetical protein
MPDWSKTFVAVLTKRDYSSDRLTLGIIPFARALSLRQLQNEETRTAEAFTSNGNFGT